MTVSTHYFLNWAYFLSWCLYCSSFLFSLTLCHFWFHHRHVYCGIALIKPNCRCEICQLTLTQPFLTTSQNIFIQASLAAACLVHFFLCQAWGGLKCRDSDRCSPAGGSGDFQVSPDWHSRPNWMSSRSLDLVFINYRPSRGSYCSRGGRRKANFTMFCVAIACIFVFIVLTLFWTAEVCPVFEKCMNIDLCPSMYYL